MRQFFMTFAKVIALYPFDEARLDFGPKEDMSVRRLQMKQTFIAAIATVVALGLPVAARAAVVVGTGNPDLDVPAVQAAVDHGGSVVLMGQFSFNRDPTT